MIGCGGDPRTQLTDADRAAVAEFRQYLHDRHAEETDPKPTEEQQ